MNLSQTKLVGLIMELDLKAREYKKLCDKLDELKEKRIDPNDERLLVVKDLFQKNHDDIVEINRQIKEVKEELKEKQKLEQYNSENIFNKKNNI
jgi:vacuolar-type H+-ATPase subunit I/STV1